MGNQTTVILNALIGAILLFAIIKVSTGTRTEEARLIQDLLKDYDTDARPAKNASQALTVTINFGYNQLQDLDEPTQVLHSLVLISLTWNDALLRWNASDYDGHSVLHLKPSRIWTPDLELYHNMEQGEGHISSEKFKITVYSDGNVSWFQTPILHSACPIDVSQFPFDTQKCMIRLGSWTYDSRALDLQLFKGTHLTDHRENAEWKLKSIRAKRRSLKYECCVAPFIDVVYTLEFQRKALYYIMTIVFPSILLSLLACISFLFPADSGERVSLVISVLLGLVVFMLIVNDRTPVTSDSVPMIIEFFNSIGVSTVLALLATAFILHLNHVSSGVPVPRYLARIRDCIAVALCMKKAPPAKPVELNFEEILLSESSTQYPSAQYLNFRDLTGQTPRKPFTEQRILIELQKLSRHLDDENIASEMKKDWRYTMKVFDRLFFIIFFIIFCFFTSHVFSFY